MRISNSVWNLCMASQVGWVRLKAWTIVVDCCVIYWAEGLGLLSLNCGDRCVRPRKSGTKLVNYCCCERLLSLMSFRVRCVAHNCYYRLLNCYLTLLITSYMSSRMIDTCDVVFPSARHSADWVLRGVSVPLFLVPHVLLSVYWPWVAATYAHPGVLIILCFLFCFIPTCIL